MAQNFQKCRNGPIFARLQGFLCKEGKTNGEVVLAKKIFFS